MPPALLLERPTALVTAPIEDTTRREFIIGIGSAALAAAFFAACGGEDDAEATPEDASDSRFPVTIPQKFGETTITSAPKRIVTFGPTDEDVVLALGHVPVGLTDWWGNYGEGRPWPWTAPTLEGAEYAVIPLDGEVHYEQIASLQPDLIIGQYCGMDAEAYGRLSEIATTVAQPGEYEDWRAPWQVMSRNIALALGKPDEGEAPIAAVDTAFAEQREQFPALADHTVLYVERGEGTFTIRGASEPRVQVLTNLGLSVPAAYHDLGEIGQEFSEEHFQVLDEADVVVWMTDEAGASSLNANPVFQNLAGVKAGRHVFVTDEVVLAAVNWSSVLSLPHAAQQLAPVIAAAL